MAFRTLRPTRVAGCPAQVYYSNRTAASLLETVILNHRTHPLRPKLLEKLATAPTDVLRWEIVTGASIRVLPKNILRTKLRSKWQAAFRAALLYHGYGADGTKLVSSPPKEGLVGRLEIVVNQAQGMNEDTEVVEGYCNNVVRALEGFQRNGGKV